MLEHLWEEKLKERKKKEALFKQTQLVPSCILPKTNKIWKKEKKTEVQKLWLSSQNR